MPKTVIKIKKKTAPVESPAHKLLAAAETLSDESSDSGRFDLFNSAPGQSKNNRIEDSDGDDSDSTMKVNFI
jgi:hypothetical protein